MLIVAAQCWRLEWMRYHAETEGNVPILEAERPTIEDLDTLMVSFYVLE